MAERGIEVRLVTSRQAAAGSDWLDEIAWTTTAWCPRSRRTQPAGAC